MDYTNSNQVLRTNLILTIIIVALLGSLWYVPYFVYANAKPVTLKQTQPLIGRVAQSMVTGGVTPSIPTYGSDFTLLNPAYYENDTWVVTAVVLKGDVVSAGYVVLQKKGSVYDVVAGPGTSFTRASIANTPDSVQQYLSKKGIVTYGPY